MQTEHVIVNNPPAENNTNSIGIIIGGLLLLLVIVLFFMYGLPAIHSIGSPQINIPDHINVNVQQNGSKGY